MARGGSKKGERRGGRQLGTPNKRTIAIAAEAARAVQEMPRSQRKLAVEIMRDFMHLFAGIAAHSQPLPPPPNETKDKQLEREQENGRKISVFEKWAKLAVMTARDVAPYESAAYASTQMPLPPPDPQQGERRRRFTLHVFERPLIEHAEGDKAAS